MPSGTKPNLKELGRTNQERYSGYVSSRDYNSNLTGIKRIRQYDLMRLGDATVNATSLAIKLPLLSARWDIKPASESRLDTQVAEAIEKELFDNGTKTWQQMLSDVLLYLDYGVMPFELVYEYRKEQSFIGLRKLAPRWPDTIYEWQTADGKDGVTQVSGFEKFSIPIEKMAIFVNQKEGDNWEGVSIYRSAYKHWYMKDKLYLVEAIAVERQGIGVPYAKPTGPSNSVDTDATEEILQNMRANEKAYVIMPYGTEIGFLDMKSGTTKSPKEIIEHHDRQIAKNVLAQFLNLGATSTGSFALSKDQSALFILSLESVARYVCDTFNRYIIKKLVDYNYTVDAYPELVYDKIGSIDLAAFSESLTKVVTAGLVAVDDTLKRHVRDVMDLPEEVGDNLADPTMADDILNELNSEMADLSGEGEPEQPDEELLQEASEAGIDITLYGGVLGQPLSEETKRKISEALKKLHGGKTTGKAKKKKDPKIASRQKEIAALQGEVRAFSAQVRREMLELRAKGIKLSPEDQAKKQLEIMDKKEVLASKIRKLKEEVAQIKDNAQSQQPEQPVKKASILSGAIQRLNRLIDRHENTN